jgi:hypothetical protein
MITARTAKTARIPFDSLAVGAGYCHCQTPTGVLAVGTCEPACGPQLPIHRDSTDLTRMCSNVDQTAARIELHIHCLKVLDQCFFHPTFYSIYIGSYFVELVTLSYHENLYEKFYHKLIMEVLSKNYPPLNPKLKSLIDDGIREYRKSHPRPDSPHASAT